MLGRIASSSLSLINAPLIARALGPDGRGETAAAIAAFFLVPILLSIGVPLEVRRLAASMTFEPLIRCARLIALCAFPLAVLLGLALDKLFFGPLEGPEHAILVAGVGMAPLMISWMCDESVLIANERFRAVAVLQLTQPLVNTVLIVFGALGGQLTVTWVMLANLGGLVATAIVGWVTVRVTIRGPFYPVRRLIRGSVPFAGSSIAEAVSNRIDQLIALPLIGSFNSGLYAVAVTICTIPIGLAHALGAGEFRGIASIAPERRKPAQQGALRSSVAVGAIFCLTLAAASPYVISILFGDKFEGAVTSVWILLFGSVLMIGNYVGSMALVAGGLGFRMTSSQVVGAVIGLISLLILGPLWGANGASAAAVIGYLSTYIFLAFAIGGNPRDFFPKPSDFTRALRVLFRTSVTGDRNDRYETRGEGAKNETP